MTDPALDALTPQLAQLHYASAPQDTDGSAPRFTAVTPGTAQAVLDEAGQLLGYEPPRDAPPHPTTAELAAFPLAFSHSLLSDGSRLLARTVCTGVDHSGRWSSFHAHGVLFPPDPYGTATDTSVLPVAGWDSPLWATGTPDGGVPLPLTGPAGPGVFGPAAFGPAAFGRDAQVRFAAARAAQLPVFFAALRALHTTDPGRRIGLVERDSADAARWIALASTVLPRAEALRLTFTTYTRRPRLAPQQIVGVLPDDAPSLSEPGQTFRIVDRATAPGSAQEPVTDVWALTAARVWLARAPELFTEAVALPAGAFSAGALAAVALCADIGLGPEARTEAAVWARAHARDLDDKRLRQVVEALCAPSEDRTAAESAALSALFGTLDSQAPSATTTLLGALVLTLAVRMPDAGHELPALQLMSLPSELRSRLAVELAPELRGGITRDSAGSGPDTARPLGLLRAAGVLGVDCADLLPALARRLARALLADPEAAWTPSLRAMVDDHFELRTALLSALDALAAEDPSAAARLLARTPLDLTGVQALPQLRMCAGAPWLPIPGGDRVTALHAALRASGVSPLADPLVLRTAVRLVWDGGAPAAGEARQMLGETGSDAHRAAGTWRALVSAALECSADDADAPDLAHELLRSFPDQLEPRVRGALQLLQFARELERGRAQPPWTQRTLTLKAAAEPVEPGVVDLVFGILARHLLSEHRPEGELYALIHCDEPELLAAYGAAARADRVRERLGAAPGYVADCFVAWSSLPGANRPWDKTRSALLDKVLRPVVRALPAEDVASVEQALERAGAHRAEEFRLWNRPGAFGRLGRRFGGLGRRPAG